MKKFLWRLLDLVHISDIILIRYYSYLKEIGWYKSYYSKTSIDANNNPIPWLTYPFIQFLDKRLTKDHSLFEYGAGNSTLWFADRVKDIDSVEHDYQWFEKIKKSMPQNANVFYETLQSKDNYTRFPTTTGKKYDLIVVDGRERVECTKQSLNALKPAGVLIFDNSYLECYNDAMEFMKNQGFNRIDFYGIGPITVHQSCTSIFYKNDNCVGI